MKKSFTLIELAVAVAILIFIAAISAPSLNLDRKRMMLDSSVKELRDVITQTQTYAFAPENPDAENYVFVLNLKGSDQTYQHTVNLEKNHYAMLSVMKNWTVFKVIKQGEIKTPITIEDKSSPNTGFVDNDKFFKIHFRVMDGLAGCFTATSKSCYIGDTGCDWKGADCNGQNLYEEIQLSLDKYNKKLKINKLTGQTEICLCANSICGTCTTI